MEENCGSPKATKVVVMMVDDGDLEEVSDKVNAHRGSHRPPRG